VATRDTNGFKFDGCDEYNVIDLGDDNCGATVATPAVVASVNSITDGLLAGDVLKCALMAVRGALYIV
jgi:hypothetical protein